MMGLKQFVLVLLIALTLAANTITLVNYQTNITVGNSVTGAPVLVSSYDRAGNNLVTGANNYLTFYTRVGGNLANAYNVTFTNNPLDAKFKDDGLWVAAIASTTTDLYLLNIPTTGTQFAINQTINIGVQPTTLTWANNGNKLIVGLSNGTLFIYNLNTTTTQFFQKQIITNAHTGSVAMVSGQTSRVVSCGATDTTVDIFNYNTTTNLYRLNQTLANAVTACTAIDLAQNEQRLAVSESTGSIIIYNDLGGNIFGNATVLINPPTASVNALRFSFDAAFLVSGSTDGVTRIYTKRDNFVTPINRTISTQTIGYAQPFNELALG
jgi:WD40 repeat protein